MSAALTLARDRSLALAQAVILHVVVIGALLFGFSFSSQRTVTPTLPPIQATMVDVSTLIAAREQKQQAEQERLRQAAAERRRQQQAERERQAEAQREQQRQQAARERRQQEQTARQQELERQRRLQQEREQQLAAVREQRLQAERDRQLQEQRLNQLADQQRAQEAERLRQLEQQRLQQLIAVESQAQSEAQRLTLEQEWQALVSALIQQNWRYPPTAIKGQRCQVRVNQIPGGAVNSVQVLSGCSWDESTRRSMEAAVLRSSPLPYQGYETVFRRQLTLDFVIPD